jgi:hypothetical protein
MESGSGLCELSFWYTDYLPSNQQVAFSGLLKAVDPRGSSSYIFDNSAESVLNEAAASALKNRSITATARQTDHLTSALVVD